MSYRIIFVISVIVVSILSATGCRTGGAVESATDGKRPPAAAPSPMADKQIRSASDEEFDGQKIVRTDKEWRQLLAAEQYHILREEGTERPYSGEYNDNHEDGAYYCRACGLKLFSSETKFESHTGWPSFYQPILEKNVTKKTDTAFGVKRVEVECSRCGSHLGHVFDDGPKPTGLRYCMNSLALKFEND